MQAFVDFADSLLGGAILIALSLALGGTAFGLAVLRPWRQPVTAEMARAGLTLVALGALGAALLQALDVGLGATVLVEWGRPGALGDFATTLQAQAAAGRIAAALLLGAAALWCRGRPTAGRRWGATALTAAGLAASGAWLAHAAGRLENRAPLMALTVLHEVGASIWVGGIAQLLALRVVARRDPGAAVLWPGVLRRFAALAVSAVALLVVAGVALAWPLVGTWDALVGSGYGSLVVTKAALMAVALALGAASFQAGRSGSRAAVARVPALATVEAIVLASVLFTAASLATQPPPVDTPGERATLAEVLEVFRPKLPTLRTPPMTTMIADASDPLAVVGGERTLAAYQWSNFSHNVAGLLLLAMSLGALAARARPGSPWRHWPAGFVALAVFVFLRSSANDGIWPFGPVGVWESVRVDAELLQHRLGALLAFLLGLLEWRARLAPRPRGAAAYVFPGLCLAGGILLLTHAHAAFEPKAYYLVQITHTTMGALAVLVGAARWLELRLGGTAGRAAGTASEVAMLAIALVLVFYREANVVVPPDTT